MKYTKSKPVGKKSPKRKVLPTESRAKASKTPNKRQKLPTASPASAQQENSIAKHKTVSFMGWSV